MRCHLTITESASREVEVELPATLGRAGDCTVVLTANGVSRHHLRLEAGEGSVYAIDLGGLNGTRRDGQRLPAHTPCAVGSGEALVLGNASVIVRFAPVEPPAPAPAALPEGALELPTSGELLVGRDPAADLVLEHPSVSRRHARIASGPAGHVIEDVGSTNGTFLRGERLSPHVPSPLRDGDVVHFGQAVFTVHEPMLVPASTGRDIRLEAIHLHQRVSATVDLLQDVSLAILPREFVAVVGVSGAGKSTLIGALSGFRPASEGVVLANGLDLYRNFDSFRTSLGYVPQDDILHRELPLQRALEYAARLRLPPDTTAEERAARVEEVLQELGLEARREVTIARLSGGQRKRVSIGAELITEPGLFFLDEATSGLDPGTEAQLMRLLRELADVGHTIVLITHATKNVALCDQVVFLARGGYLAYFGPPNEALEYFEVDDFDGIYERLEGEGTPEAWAARYRDSTQYRRFVEERLGDRLHEPPAPAAKNAGAPAVPRTGFFAQTAVLTRRYLDVLTRDRTTLLLLLLIAPALGAIDLVAWRRDILLFESGDPFRSGIMLFLAALIPFMIGSLTSVRELVKEEAIYRRERAVGLRLLPYLLSKIIVLFSLSVLWAVVLVAMRLMAIELPDMSLANVAALTVTVFLGAASGVMVGLLISALVKRDEQAMLYAVGVLVVQMVFSGGLVPLKDLGPVGQGLGVVTNTHWVLRGMLNVLDYQTGECEQPPFDTCRIPGLGELQTEAEKAVAIAPTLDRADGLLGTPLTLAWGMAVFLLVVMFVALVFLKRRRDTF